MAEQEHCEVHIHDSPFIQFTKDYGDSPFDPMERKKDCLNILSNYSRQTTHHELQIGGFFIKGQGYIDRNVNEKKKKK